MKTAKLLIIASLNLLLFFLSTQNASALCCDPSVPDPCPAVSGYNATCSVNSNECPTDYECDYTRITGPGIDWRFLYQEHPQDPAQADFQFRVALTISEVIDPLLKYIFPVAGLLLLLYLLYGGFQYLTSAGDPRKTESARKVITYAFTGFIIIFISYWITQIASRVLGIPEVDISTDVVGCTDGDGGKNLTRASEAFGSNVNCPQYDTCVDSATIAEAECGISRDANNDCIIRTYLCALDIPGTHCDSGICVPDAPTSTPTPFSFWVSNTVTTTCEQACTIVAGASSCTDTCTGVIGNYALLCQGQITSAISHNCYTPVDQECINILSPDLPDLPPNDNAWCCCQP